MSTQARVAGGSVAPGYEAVREAFERACAGGGGCAFAAVVDGRGVVDLWTGGWGADTSAVLFSGTKGVVATALLCLVERGRLDLDAAVTRYWPEFGAAGKAGITVAELLAHCAGLPGVEARLSRADLARPRRIARLLAAQGPMVAPGRPCYHAVTWGWLAGELVERVVGASAGRLVATDLAGPLALDLGIGAAGPAVARPVAAPVPAADYRLSAYLGGDPDPRLELVYGNPRVGVADWADPALVAIEVPAVNGVATARAMARLYGAVAAGALLRPETIARGRAPAAEGADSLTDRPLRFGPTGYELAGTPSELGPADDAFGHTGTGGGSHGAWPSARTGFSFLPADLRPENGDGRAEAVLAELHQAVASA